jgi:hypothetical protein
MSECLLIIQRKVRDNTYVFNSISVVTEETRILKALDFKQEKETHQKQVSLQF